MMLDCDTLTGLAAAVHGRCGVPAMAMAVVTPGGRPWLGALGLADVEAGVACSPETGFAIASLTKTYTAALALIVQREGRLNLDDPLNRHLPWFRLGRSLGGQAPTLRDALSHRSGLAGYEELWYNSPWSRREILSRLASAVPAYAPTDRFAYSNLMYLAAGEAIAQAAGMPYEEALRSRLLAPCGDRRTGLGWPNATSAARPYQRVVSGNGAPGELKRLGQLHVPAADPAVGLNGSAASLAAWMELLLGGGNRTLPAEAIEQMWMPHVEVRAADEPRIHGFYGRTRRLDYGLGWFLGEHNGLTTISHTGSLPGFRCHIALVPSRGTGVVALANLNQTFAPEIFVYQALDRIAAGPNVDWFDHFDGVARERARMQTDCAASEDGDSAAAERFDAEEICGSYVEDVLGVVRVWRAPQELKFGWANYTGALARCHDGRYRVTGIDCPLLGGDQPVEFLTTPDGGLRGLRFLGYELRKSTCTTPSTAGFPALAFA